MPFWWAVNLESDSKTTPSVATAAIARLILLPPLLLGFEDTPKESAISKTPQGGGLSRNDALRYGRLSFSIHPGHWLRRMRIVLTGSSEPMTESSTFIAASSWAARLRSSSALAAAPSHARIVDSLTARRSAT